VLSSTAGFGQQRTYPNVEGMRGLMKKFALGASILLGMLISSGVSASRILTCDRTSSQPNLGACSYDDLVAAENEMDSVYRSVVAKYASNSLFLERLAHAQKSWLTFREDDWKAQFACPEFNTQLCWGAKAFIYVNERRTKLTKEREQSLRSLLENGPGR